MEREKNGASKEPSMETENKGEAMKVTLPNVTRTIFKRPDSPNSITQFISPSVELNLNITEAAGHFAVIEDNGLAYYFTSKADDIPADYKFVLLTNINPTKGQFHKNKVKIRTWLKHPELKQHSTTDVISSWNNNFYYKEEDKEHEILGLRQPQIAALYSTMGNLKLQMEAATVVMPTGTGKTETMLSLLIANRCKRLLVTVPSDSLRNQIAEKFFSLGLLKKFGVIGGDALYPIVGVIKGKFGSATELKDFIERCNVVVSTMAWLTSQTPSDQELISSSFSNIFIDEAHHVKAASWNEFRECFSNEKIVQFTATPFRNDGKRLDGKIVSNFPLRKAQEQGYYKKIEFLPIREYDNNAADAKIAQVAIQRLRDDIKKGFNHILMARCSTKNRADEVYKLYSAETDLNPVLIYSGITNFKSIYEQIIEKRAKIIVCVDMLGEGFDLPELKIAAFHDIRRSLPITLQFAGRFTRTKYDEQLGDASFIANIADLEVRAELADLYAEDADWNDILSDTSFQKINEQVEFKDFMEGFNKLNESNIPFQNIKPKMSTVVYKNKAVDWNPLSFHQGIPGYADLEYKFFDFNKEQEMLVVITGRRIEVEWVHHKEIHDISWDIIIVFLDRKNNLLFINSSDNGSVYQELAEAVIGSTAELIKGIDVFKSFYNIKRVKLQNVGLRQFLGKNIRFRMMVGSDVGEALTLAERQRGEKAFVMGNGFENGSPVNIGASYKGRIWTKLKTDLKYFKKWCIELGDKLIDPKIDSNQILKETLIPTLIKDIPMIYPVWIDWDVDMYLETESKFKFFLNGFRYDLSNVELCLENAKPGGPIQFSIIAEDRKAVFQLNLFETTVDGESYPDFNIIQISAETVEVEHGTRKYSGVEFFSKYIPTVWFADGSALTGNEYIELKQSISLYPQDAIIAWDWSGVDLIKESQHVFPKRIDSIQFKVIQELKSQDFDIIYDDDYSGEIADVIALKQLPEKILIKMFHLKYALEGKVTNQIKNFYEVCGQAQKSIHWKHKGGKEFVNHLLKRQKKTRGTHTSSRIEKGTSDDLIRLFNVAKNEIPIEFEIFIVQPGLSKANASKDILTLLGVTETYIKEFADINLKVITSN